MTSPTLSAASGGVPPIIDGRGQLSWQRRLPARLGTGALWLGSLSLLGPLKLLAVVLVGGLLAPCVWALDRDPRGRRGGGPDTALATPPPARPRAERPQPGLPRAAVAAQLGLPESLLFRARHGAICTVHHDGEGRIVAIHLPGPAAAESVARPDAHPVG